MEYEQRLFFRSQLLFCLVHFVTFIIFKFKSLLNQRAVQLELCTLEESSILISKVFLVMLLILNLLQQPLKVLHEGFHWDRD